jgi:two-component system cell cycle response regulator DivK
VLQHYSPVSLLVRPDFAIIDQIGDVGLYISWPNNGKTANLLDALDPSFRKDLTEAAAQAFQHAYTLQSQPIFPDNNGILRSFRLQIRPLTSLEEIGDVLQVLFMLPNAEAPNAESDHTVGTANSIAVEAELRRTREQVTALKKQLQAVKARTDSPAANPSAVSLPKMRQQNSELRSTNKELLALNRDLVRRVEELRKKMRQQASAEQQAPPSAPVVQQALVQQTGAGTALQQQLVQFISHRHEVRTALTSIMGFADLLAERLYDADNKELAKYIGKAGNRLSESLGPLLTQDMDDAEASISGPEPFSEESDLFSSGRLLVVEDSDATRRLLTLVLSDRFDCEVASDASEAIEKAEKELFKAVLLDINLGTGQSGVDVMEYLKKKHPYRQVPFMAVTAMASPQDESMLLRRGFDAFVAKPFQKAKLLNTLDAMLEQKNAA